jgi:S4 domain
MTMAAAITNTTHVITRAALISNCWEQLSNVMLYCFSMQVLAAAGVASRRACIDLVKAGAVSVNGTRVSDPATRVSCSKDILSVNGKPVARVCRCAQLHILACGRRWPPGALQCSVCFAYCIICAAPDTQGDSSTMPHQPLMISRCCTAFCCSPVCLHQGTTLRCTSPRVTSVALLLAVSGGQ